MDQDVSLLGAFAFLILGVISQALIQRYVYPALSRAHERAKVTGRQTISPARVMLIMRFVNFLALPAIGLFIGRALFN